jgi:hypothetical protein
MREGAGGIGGRLGAGFGSSKSKARGKCTAKGARFARTIIMSWPFDPAAAGSQDELKPRPTKIKGERTARRRLVCRGPSMLPPAGSQDELKSRPTKIKGERTARRRLVCRGPSILPPAGSQDELKSRPTRIKARGGAVVNAAKGHFMVLDSRGGKSEERSLAAAGRLRMTASPARGRTVNSWSSL